MDIYSKVYLKLIQNYPACTHCINIYSDKLHSVSYYNMCIYYNIIVPIYYVLLCNILLAVFLNHLTVSLNIICSTTEKIHIGTYV